MKQVTKGRCTDSRIVKVETISCRLFSVLLFIMISCSTYGQQLSVSERIVYKKLSNGFSYYVIPEENPGKIELYLLSNTGAMVEKPEERGIAHFLEHMVFKGSKNFPGGKTIDALENMGLRIGQDYNGSVKNTLSEYNIIVPDNNKAHLDQALSLLSDWAFELAMDEADFKVEQKVVIEELQQRDGRSAFPYFKGTILEGHRGLGDQELVRSFTSQRVLDFYKKYYTPDQLALVVLGKVDQQALEHAIEKKFGKAPVCKKQLVNKYPDLASTTIIAGDFEDRTDREKAAVLSLAFKYPRVAIDSYAAFKNNMVQSIFASMLENRLSSTSHTSITSIAINNSILVPGTGMFTLRLRGKQQTRYAELLTDFCTVLATVKKYGFLPDEVQHATQSLLDKYAGGKDELFPSVYQAASHLIDGDTPLSGMERYALAQQLAAQIKVEDFSILLNDFLSYHKTILYDRKSDEYDQQFTDAFILNQLQDIDQLAVVPFAYVKPREKFMRKQQSTATVQIDTKIPVKVQEKVELGNYLYLLKYENGTQVLVNCAPKATTQVKIVSDQGLNIIPEADRSLMQSALPVLNTGFGMYSSVAANNLLRELGLFKDVKLKSYGYELGLKGSPENIESLLKVFNLFITTEQAPTMDHFIRELKTKRQSNDIADTYEGFMDEVLGQTLSSPAYTASAVTEADLVRLMHYNRLLKTNLRHSYVYVGGASLPEHIDELIGRYIATIEPSTEQASNRAEATQAEAQQVTVKKFNWSSEGTKVEYLFTDGSKPIRFKDKLIAEAIAEYGYKRLFDILRMKHGFIYAMGTTAISNNATALAALSFRYIINEEKNLAPSYAAVENEILIPISQGRFTNADVHKMKALIENNYQTSFYDEDHIAGSYLTDALAYGQLYTRDEIHKIIHAISAKDIKKVAKQLIRLDRYYKILKVQSMD